MADQGFLSDPLREAVVENIPSLLGPLNRRGLFFAQAFLKAGSLPDKCFKSGQHYVKQFYLLRGNLLLNSILRFLAYPLARR